MSSSIHARSKCGGLPIASISFHRKVFLFAEQVPKADLALLKHTFSATFSKNDFFTRNRVRYLLKMCKKQITGKQQARTFALSLPSYLIKRIFQDIKSFFSESIRARVALYDCNARNLDAHDTLENMQLLCIESEKLRYKCALQAIKRGAPDIIDAFTQFGIQDPKRIRRLAELSMYFDADAFFSDLNEFNFTDDAIRETFYLRGLARSSEVVAKLLEDGFFLTSLRILSPKALAFIYAHFKYGESLIQKTLFQAQSLVQKRATFIATHQDVAEQIASEMKALLKKLHSKDLSASSAFISSISRIYSFLREDLALPKDHATWITEGLIVYPIKAYISKEDTSLSKAHVEFIAHTFTIDTPFSAEEFVFILFIQQADSPILLQNMELCQSSLFDELHSHDQQSLLAMLLLLKSLDNPEELETPPVLDFLAELTSFPDRGARFAAVSLAREGIKIGCTLSSQLSHSSVVNYPKLHSLVVSTCERIVPTIPMSDMEGALKKKWKNNDFIKEFVHFLAELICSERLSTLHSKQRILVRFFEEVDLQTVEALRDLSLCLRNGLITPLYNREKPIEILANMLGTLLNRLGKPYGYSLSLERLEQLQYKQDICYYIQSLERLPVREKERMVPFFFRFLNLLIEGKMKEERFNTPELHRLFSNYPKLEVWKSEESYTIQEMASKYPALLSLDFPEELDIPNRLRIAFEEGHLQEGECPGFFDYLHNRGAAPELEGRIFGEYQKNGTEEQKKQAASHLLYKLFSQTTSTEQLRFIKQLKKTFSRNANFKTDLTQLEKSLNNQNHHQDKGYNNYRIQRVYDPYTLFRIGSVAGETCQRVTGDPAINKCLLAYPCDGKNQVIVAINEEGEIEARAILRFFYTDAPTPFPVLYLEPCYPAGAPSILRAAINLMAMQCAQSVHVPLLTKLKKDTDLPYAHSLQTINGPAPFEYYDGTTAKVHENDEPDKGATRTDFIHNSKITEMKFDE